MDPADLNLREGERPSLKCPDCDRWRLIRKGLVGAHRLSEAEAPTTSQHEATERARRYRDEVQAGKIENGPRCKDSMRRFIADLDPAEWTAAWWKLIRPLPTAGPPR